MGNICRCGTQPSQKKKEARQAPFTNIHNTKTRKVKRPAFPEGKIGHVVELFGVGPDADLLLKARNSPLEDAQHLE